jgi:hypothetical protein
MRRQRRAPVLLDQPAEPIEPLMLTAERERRLRRRHVDDEHAVEPLGAPEPVQIVAEPLDGLRHRLPARYERASARAPRRGGPTTIGEAGPHSRLDRLEVAFELRHERFGHRGVVAGQRARVLDKPGRRDVPAAEGEVAQPDERQSHELRQLGHEAAARREPAHDRPRAEDHSGGEAPLGAH